MNETQEVEVIILAVLVVGLSCFLPLWFPIESLEESKMAETTWNASQIEKEVEFYWACMDGCSNMQEIIFGEEVYETNNTHNGMEMVTYHTICAYECCEKYMETLGCYDPSDRDEPVVIAVEE